MTKSRVPFAVNLGHLLVGKGLLTVGQVEDAAALQRSEGLRMDRAIIQLGFVSERQMLELMSEQLHLPLVELQVK